jgi:hypothetical protein
MFTRGRKNRFAPNLACLFLQTSKRTQEGHKSGKVSRVRFPVRAVPVAVSVLILSSKHTQNLFYRTVFRFNRLVTYWYETVKVIRLYASCSRHVYPQARAALGCIFCSVNRYTKLQSRTPCHSTLYNTLRWIKRIDKPWQSIRLKTRTSGGSGDHGNEPSGSMKVCDFPGYLSTLLVSQEGLCFMETVQVVDSPS